MSVVTLTEAELCLSDLIRRLQPGEECVITDAGRPLAQIKKLEFTTHPCKAGSAKGKIHIAPDFEEPLEEFKEYTE